MARRQRKADELGPAVPRWVVEFHDAQWPGGYDEWDRAVHDWANEHLYRREHFGAWMDIIRNTFVIQGELRDQGYWADGAA